MSILIVEFNMSAQVVSSIWQDFIAKTKLEIKEYSF